MSLHSAHTNRRGFLAATAALILGTAACERTGGTASNAALGRKHVWKFTAVDGHWIGGVIHADGTLYATAYGEAQPTGSAYAIDAATGAVKWTFRGKSSVGDPLVIGDALVYGTGWGEAKHGLWYGLDAATGAERWRLPGMTVEATTSPVVVDGVIYSATLPAYRQDAELWAFTAAEGRVLWKLPVEGAAVRTAATGGVLLHRGPDRKGIGIDMAKGTVRWTADDVGLSVYGEAFAYQDTFVVGGSRTGDVASDGVVALDAATGRLRWQTPPELAVVELHLSGDTVYYLTKTDVGALDAATGARKWSTAAPTAASGDIHHWATGHGAVYITSGTVKTEGVLTAFDTTTGKPRWTVESGVENVPHGPVVDATTVYVETGGTAVTGLDPATGKPRWHLADGPSTLTETPLVTPHMLYVSHLSEMYAIPPA
ncbi:PQQ-binding-like beta-propeller repeat protein [Uniformispora flossi]|uniref:PQQ-binding-like beta-propeller repeat protein n=1 Tax=Uniformispora flossi TaxID=3390723 RepID=UPI003C2B15E4